MRHLSASLVCDRVREQISVGLDGELSQLERAMLSSHLERCAECRGYEQSVTAFTQALRAEPLAPLSRPVVVQPQRRFVTTRLQIGAAAAVAVAALFGGGELLKSKPIEIRPTFVPTGRSQPKMPTQNDLQREQAMLERAQVGRPVQIRGRVI
jgi:putative zinc finger protein